MAVRALLLGLCLAAGGLTFVAPAGADQNQCVDEVDLCVATASGESGTGTCEAASGDYYEQYRRATVTYDDGSQVHQVYVENFCYAVGGGWGYEEHGSGLGAGYHGFGEDFSAVRAGWSGFEWSTGEDGGSDCALYLFIYNMPPVPDRQERLDCPTGEGPGVLLPPLP